MEKLGKLTDKSIAVLTLERQRRRCGVRSIKFDRLPSLAKAGRFLFMLRVSELHLEDGSKTLFRFLHPLERFAAQGLDPAAAGTYLPHQLLIKAASNANPPNILAPFLCPIIHAMAKWGGLFGAVCPREEGENDEEKHTPASCGNSTACKDLISSLDDCAMANVTPCSDDCDECGT